jgi:hypothetical protein
MPLNDDWKKKYDFRPDVAVNTMSMTCPSVSPFIRKPDPPKENASTSGAGTSAASGGKEKCCKLS